MQFERASHLLGLVALATLTCSCDGSGGGGTSAPAPDPTPESIEAPAVGEALRLSVFHTASGLADPSVVPAGEVFEISMRLNRDFGLQRNFADVKIEAVFESPSGEFVTVGGFFFDRLPSGVSIWKLRFAPRELGNWDYQLAFENSVEGIDERGSGSFRVVPSSSQGYLRISPVNPFRWIFDDNKPFAPLGINVCLRRKDNVELDGGDRRGAFRGDLQGRVPLDVYLAAMSAAGFNLFRFSQNNCSIDVVSSDLTIYKLEAAKDFDRIFTSLREHDFRVMFGLFGFLLPERTTAPTPEELRFITYCANRWGVYVDVWELQNERHSTAEWIDPAAAHLRSQDPYSHPISTSWRKPEVASVEVNAPHWYTKEDAVDSARDTSNRADLWKAEAQKPVIVGETGNVGSAWSAGSLLRTRIRNWTALFKEIAFVYWDASWATNHNGLFLYIGLRERVQFQIMQRFSETVLRNDSRVSSLALSNASVEGFALESSKGVAFYLHQIVDHAGPVQGLEVEIDSVIAGAGRWIEPATGRVLGTAAISPGKNLLVAPEFTVDLAFFSSAVPLATEPLALVSFSNPQDDGDTDNDGLLDYGPPLPFGQAPLELSFDASASYDLDGGSVTWEWDFGDGSPIETAPILKHTFSRGIHVVTLTVIDEEGQRARQVFLVQATADPNPDFNDPPELAPMGLEAVTIFEGEPLALSPTATDRELIGSLYPDSEVVTYFANGLPEGAKFSGAQNDPTLSWTPDFEQSGTYSVDILAMDPHGTMTPIRTVVITVQDSPLRFSNKVSAD